MSGWTDLPLTPEGVREAEHLADLFVTRSHLDCLYSSPLRRALDTARSITSRCPGAILLDPRLKEINCGDADGLPINEVKARHPEHWARNQRQDDPDFCWPGGESYRELRSRCIAVAQDIAHTHVGRRVVAVTHAGVISQLLGWIEHVSPARWELFRPRNASITELEWSGDRARIIEFDVLL